MIKAKFKNSKAALKDYSRFVLGVSMGSQNHSNDAFSATVQCLNEEEFDRGIIDVSDSLKRYSFMRNHTAEQADKLAKALGSVWRAENEEALDQFAMPVDIVHWQQWLDDPRFDGYLKAFKNAYENQDALRKAVNKDIEGYLSRSFNGSVKDQSDIDLSVRFYLEELAVMSIQFEDNPAAQIYAGKELNCLKAVRSGAVKDIPTGIQNAKFFRLNVYDAPNDNTPS